MFVFNKSSAYRKVGYVFFFFSNFQQSSLVLNKMVYHFICKTAIQYLCRYFFMQQRNFFLYFFIKCINISKCFRRVQEEREVAQHTINNSCECGYPRNYGHKARGPKGSAIDIWQVNIPRRLIFHLPSSPKREKLQSLGSSYNEFNVFLGLIT